MQVGESWDEAGGGEVYMGKVKSVQSCLQSKDHLASCALSSSPCPSEFLPWGDSDSESDDDTRGVVGLNAQFDWTKEADPDHKIDQ